MFRACKPVVALFAALWFAAAVHAAEEPKVSRAMEKPLKACNDAYEAKRFEEAIAKCKDAQTLPNRTEYDNFVINQIMAVSYVQTKHFQEAYPLLKEVVASSHVNPRVRDTFLGTIAQIGATLKDYAGSAEYAQKAIEAGNDNPELRNLLAQDYYALGKYKEAVTTLQEQLNRAERAGQKPSENTLLLMFSSYTKLNDNAGQGRMIEKLVTYYPKPDYWQNAMISLSEPARKDDRLLLQLYRLQADVGTLKNNQQYGEMAKLDMEQGYPGEAEMVLEEAMKKNVFTDAREKAQYQRLEEAAKKALASERENIGKSEQEATRTGNGDLMVAVGGSYLLNLGEPQKAITLIQQGIAKGLNKVPLYDAYVTLGLAYARAKQGAEAKQAFAKVDKNDNFERLAKLWSLRVR